MKKYFKDNFRLLFIAVLSLSIIFIMCSCAEIIVSGIYAGDRRYSTRNSPISFDGKYKIVTEFEGNEKFVKVVSNDDKEEIIYTVSTEIYPSEIGYPIDTYWGLNNYDFFILSSDMGTCMLKYENGSWVEDYHLEIEKNTDGEYIAQLYSYEESMEDILLPYDIKNVPKEIYDYILDIRD